MAARITSYEWAVEMTDDDSGDILDVSFWDTYWQALANASLPPEPGCHAVIALVRNVHYKADGDLIDKSYAYLKDGRLPVEFDDGLPVPQRFHAEVR